MHDVAEAEVPLHDGRHMPPTQVSSETIEAHSAFCAVLDRALRPDMGTDERLLALAALMAARVRGRRQPEALLVQACRQAAALRADGTVAPLRPARCCCWSESFA